MMGLASPRVHKTRFLIVFFRGISSRAGRWDMGWDWRLLRSWWI